MKLYQLLTLFIFCSCTYLAGQVPLDTAKVKVYITEAQALFDQFNYPAAEQEAQKAIDVFNPYPDTIFPLHAGAYRIMGGILARQGRAEEARVALKKAKTIYAAIKPVNHEFIA
ncbi:MAG: tetratricopeptide repeat protein, partial [Bacteroidota bacterium]